MLFTTTTPAPQHTSPYTRWPPLSATSYFLALLLTLSAIPFSLYLDTHCLDSFRPTAVAMSQDLKKLAPQAQALRKGPYTAEVAGTPKVDGETIPRRNLAATERLKTVPNDDVKTLYDIMRHASAKYGNAKAVGSRRIVNRITETKKIKKMIDGKEQLVDKNWEYFELSGFKFKSFIEFEKMTLAVGSAIQKLGFKPKDKMHIFAATSVQWFASTHGEHTRQR
jgi:long-chain acyl-CoA synthetase